MLPTAQDLLTTAEAIARQAGEVIRQHAARPEESVQTKSSGMDLVTAADRAAEAVIVKAIRAAYPDHHVVGEEGGAYGVPADAPFVWYVDPVDGTTNFAHRFPYYSVSIAVAEPDGEPLAGVVYDPAHDDCFAAARGGGATLNGRPLHVSSTDGLARALLVSGFPYDRVTNPDNNTREWLAFLPLVHDMRRVGSAALDLAYLAAGYSDGYWELRLNTWDLLAGVLIVREAGGTVTTLTGDTAGLYEGQRGVLASNGRLHDSLVAVLQSIRG